MQDYDRVEATSDPSVPSALSNLDRELERLDQAVDQLRSRLAPVSTTNLEAQLERVQPDARSYLQSKAERLADLTGQIDRITRQLDI